jgi:hypothetical protein
MQSTPLVPSMRSAKDWQHNEGRLPENRGKRKDKDSEEGGPEESPVLWPSRMILSQAQAQKLEARQEDLHVWEQKKVKDTKKGAKAYTYFMASWRSGGKLRNVTWALPIRWKANAGKFLILDIIRNCE